MENESLECLFRFLQIYYDYRGCGYQKQKMERFRLLNILACVCVCLDHCVCVRVCSDAWDPAV